MDNSENELTERKEKKRTRPTSSLRNALIAYGESQADESSGRSNAEELAVVAWERAIAGNMEWVNFIRDTMCGKPSQSLEVSADGGDGSITLNLVNFAPAVVAQPPQPVEKAIDVTPEPDVDLGDLV